MKYLHVLLLIYVLFFISSRNVLGQHNSVRAVHIPENVSLGNIPNEFLERVRIAGYTHVMVPIPFGNDEWADGKYNDITTLNLLRDAFKAMKEKDLRLIPVITCGSKYCDDLINVKNPNIKFEPIFNNILEGQAWNAAKENDFIFNIISSFMEGEESKEVKVSNVPSFAEDQQGLSLSFRSMVNDLIRPAFNESGVADSEFDFILMTYDEPVEFSGTVDKTKKCLIGKSQADMAWMYKHDPVNHYKIGRTSRDYESLIPLLIELGYSEESLLNPSFVYGSLDISEDFREYFSRFHSDRIASYYSSLGTDYHRLSVDDSCLYFADYTNSEYLEGVRELYADHITHRVQDIKDFLPKVRVLMYADMLDPQHSGDYLNTCKTVEILKTKEVLVDGTYQYLTDNLVLMPWQYQNTYTHHLEAKLDEEKTKINPSTTEALIHVAAEWLACPAGCAHTPFPLTCTAWCFGHTVKYVVDYVTKIAEFKAVIEYDATGQKYDPLVTFNHFINNGFSFIYQNAFSGTTDKAAVVSHSLSQTVKYAEASALLIPPNDKFSLGYAVATFGDDWKTNELYNQPEGFNIIELASALNQTVADQQTALFFNELLKVSEVLVAKNPISKLDYLVASKNLYDPRLDIVNEPRTDVTLNDVLLFCNKLSEREGLTPVYTLNNIQYNNSIEHNAPVVNNCTVESNAAADGYRLPTFDELLAIIGDPKFVKPLSLKGELCFETNYGCNYNGQPFGLLPNQMLVGRNIGFRVVKQSIPDDIVLKNFRPSSSLLPFWARNSVTIDGGYIAPGVSILINAGNKIVIDPAAFTSAEGSKLILRIDPTLRK